LFFFVMQVAAILSYVCPVCHFLILLVRLGGSPDGRVFQLPSMRWPLCLSASIRPHSMNLSSCVPLSASPSRNKKFVPINKI
jgi:hypothetical protein